MKTLEHTGDSANVAFYANDDYLVEVLRQAIEKRNGEWHKKPVPDYLIYMRRRSGREIGRFRYQPRESSPHLDPRTVTKLVRERLFRGNYEVTQPNP